MEWRPVPAFDNKYEVSTDGTVRYRKYDTVTETVKYRDVKVSGKHPCVSFVVDHNPRVYPVDFLVACAFLGCDINATPKAKIEHIDGDYLNCRLDNLRVVNTSVLPDEIWKDIPEFDGEYQVSNMGRVKRCRREDHYIRKDTGKECVRVTGELILKPAVTQGYHEVNPVYHGKSVYRRIHRLVAEAFIPNPDGLPVVNHIDGDKFNNRADNLEWCTDAETVHHAIEHNLRISPAKGVYRGPLKFRCIETGQVFDNCKIGAEALNIPYYYLSECVRLCKPCHGLHFEILKEEKGR